MATERNIESSRRRVPRRSFDAMIGVLFKGKYQLERGYQIGERGIMISGVRPMKAGEQVIVNFYVNVSVLITVRGVIRSVVPAQGEHPVRYGLEFLNLEFHFKREIRNFVAAATQTMPMAG